MSNADMNNGYNDSDHSGTERLAGRHDARQHEKHQLMLEDDDDAYLLEDDAEAIATAGEPRQKRGMSRRRDIEQRMDDRRLQQQLAEYYDDL